MTVRVLCRPEVAAGFALAGLAVTRAGPGAASAEALTRLTTEAGAGIVLVDEALYLSLPRDLMARLDRAASPILVPVPAPTWEDRGAAEAFVMEILRQAIGYRVRPR
jgi:vacuolar-type H+-ATPase subunit F/Vma7